MMIADLERIEDILTSFNQGHICIDLALSLAYHRGTQDGRAVYEEALTNETVDEYLYAEEMGYEAYEPENFRSEEEP